MISSGVGEDISFDIEVISKFGTMVLLIDPVIRAKNHVEDYLINSTDKKISNYSFGGKRKVTEYISNSRIKESIIFIPFALWNSSKNLKFWPPENSENVSYSINKRNSVVPIIYSTITVKEIIKQYQLHIANKVFAIFKMDIEGAELNNLIFSKAWRNVKQVLIEFDSLREMKIITFIKFISAIITLRKEHYTLISIEGLNTLWLKYEK
jgi:hypothetical protein